MVERFLALKEGIQEISKTDDEYHLTVQEWAEVRKIKNSLQPCKKATLLLQKEDCSLRDLSIVISNCLLEMRKIGGYFLYSAFSNINKIMLNYLVFNFRSRTRCNLDGLSD